jgi:hypothetical protein
MNFVKLFIPGNFEDAYLYKGQLLMLTEDRTIHVYELERVVELLNAQYPDLRPVPELMFLRNDWLVSSQFGSLMQNQDVARAVLGAFRRCDKRLLELNNGMFEPRVQNLEVPARVLLDVMLYNDRMYVGADTGLYDFDVDFRVYAAEALSRPTKRSDARCLQTAARFGAVSASCGDDGLFTAVDDFGVLSYEGRSEMRKVADVSLKSAWMRHDLVNYSTFTTPLLLQSTYERDYGGRLAPDRTVITHIGSYGIDLSYLLQTLRDARGVTLEDIQYVYNSDTMMFVHTWSEDFYSLGIRNPERGEPSVHSAKTYKGTGTRILSAAQSKVGVVVETDNRVLLLADDEWLPVEESEVISVRTFPRSRRFQNVVALTKEDGLLLVALFDEAPFTQLEKK